jgi:predicted  nucleic acid-binding Zn-ribbon protein
MKTKIYDQHSEHGEWLNKLLFYGVEMKIMQKRLDDASGNSADADTMKEIEHFQNQIIIQTRNITELSKHIKGDEKALEKNIAENIVAADHRSVEDHAQERDMVESFEKNFNDLRKEFNGFLSRQHKH